MATGDTLIELTARDGDLPSSNAARLALVNGHTVGKFDSEEEMHFLVAGLPAAYAGGGLTIVIFWYMDTATSGDLEWRVTIDRLQNNVTNFKTTTFGSNQAASVTVPGTAGVVAVSSVTFTSGSQMDSLVAGESLRVRLKEGGNTTASGDSVFLGMKVSET